MSSDDEQIAVSADCLDSKQTDYHSDVSETDIMAETPLRQPIAAFVRHSICSHADYLYFSDVYLSKCVHGPSYVKQHQVNLTDFVVLVIFLCDLDGCGRTAGNY